MLGLILPTCSNPYLAMLAADFLTEGFEISSQEPEIVLSSTGMICSKLMLTSQP